MMCLGAGARDINCFKAGLREGHLPAIDSLTYQGLFNQHWYQTGGPETKHAVGVAAVGARAGDLALPWHPADQDEVWVGCCLKGLRDGKPRDSTPMDLIVVLDTSGSMSTCMQRGTSRPSEGDQPADSSRLGLAKAALCKLLSKLRGDDGFGLATFTTVGKLVQPLALVGTLDQAALVGRIGGLTAGGGTTLAAGMQAAIDIREAAAAMPSGLRNQRLLFLTDMEDLTPGPLDDMIEQQARQDCYVSFVGISSGFNSELAEVTSKHKGCNYFCITKDDELDKVTVDDFDWNFFPAAFDVEVTHQSGDFDFTAVYGTPYDAKEEVMQADWTPLTHGFYPPQFRMQARQLLLCARRVLRGPRETLATPTGGTGCALPMPAVQRILDFLSPAVRSVIRLDTVFPSGVGGDGSVEGGLVLLRLRPRPGHGVTATGKVRLMLRYTADGQPSASCLDVDIPGKSPNLSAAEAASNSDSAMTPALRKGLVLQRFIEVCRRFLEVANGDGSTQGKLLASARHFRPQPRAADVGAVDSGDKSGRLPQLRVALKDVEDLSSALGGSEVVAAEIEMMCPGVLKQLRSFVDKARKHVNGPDD